MLFDNVVAKEGSQVEFSVILPEVNIGKNVVIKRAIVDRHCDIPDGMEIGVDLELDAKRFRVSKGKVVLVTSRMLNKLKQEAEEQTKKVYKAEP